MKSAFQQLLFWALFASSGMVNAQCTWYTITVTDSPNAGEVTWELIDDLGVTWASGGAPYDLDICLPDGCYTLLMFDSAGNGWEDEDWIIEDWTGDFDWDTNLDDGFHGNDILDLGDSGCGNSTGGDCPPGTSSYMLVISAGSNPGENSWTLTLGSTVIISGGTPYNSDVCLGDGCYFINMSDSGANGWQGATYQLYDENTLLLQSGTLSSGSSESVLINLGGLDCSDADPGGGGGGGGGSGCGSEQPSSDCATAPCVCDPYSFNISPSGYGTINEVPSPGSVSNPSYGPLNNAPWGGSDYGCLLAGELNSSWMVFSVSSSGTLEFSFGVGGEQSGYYDWAMWPYSETTTCDGIVANTLSPVRCTWNAVSWGGTGLASMIPAGGNAGNYGPPLNVTAGEQFIICLSNWSYVTDQVTLDFFGSAVIDCSILLPTKFLAFDAHLLSQTSFLTWSVTSEYDCFSYQVEHSTDGIFWQSLSSQPCIGNFESTATYSAEHINPALGLNYYRIRQSDYDGAATYSDIRVLDNNGVESLSVFPNPANSILHVHLSQGLESGRFLVLNQLGQKLVDGSIDKNRIQIDVSVFSSGSYILLVLNNFGKRQVMHFNVDHTL